MLVTAIYPVQDQVAAQTVLVIWQTGNGNTMPLWRLDVWRVTVVNSRQVSRSPAVPAKST
jgi:hypothetical protein